MARRARRRPAPPPAAAAAAPPPTSASPAPAASSTWASPSWRRRPPPPRWRRRAPAATVSGPLTASFDGGVAKSAAVCLALLPDGVVRFEDPAAGGGVQQRALPGAPPLPLRVIMQHPRDAPLSEALAGGDDAATFGDKVRAVVRGQLPCRPPVATDVASAGRDGELHLADGTVLGASGWGAPARQHALVMTAAAAAAARGGALPLDYAAGTPVLQPTAPFDFDGLAASANAALVHRLGSAMAAQRGELYDPAAHAEEAATVREDVARMIGGLGRALAVGGLDPGGDAAANAHANSLMLCLVQGCTATERRYVRPAGKAEAAAAELAELLGDEDEGGERAYTPVTTDQQMMDDPWGAVAAEANNLGSEMLKAANDAVGAVGGMFGALGDLIGCLWAQIWNMVGQWIIDFADCMFQNVLYGISFGLAGSRKNCNDLFDMSRPRNAIRVCLSSDPSSPLSKLSEQVGKIRDAFTRLFRDLIPSFFTVVVPQIVIAVALSALNPMVAGLVSGARAVANAALRPFADRIRSTLRPFEGVPDQVDKARASYLTYARSADGITLMVVSVVCILLLMAGVGPLLASGFRNQWWGVFKALQWRTP